MAPLTHAIDPRYVAYLHVGGGYGSDGVSIDTDGNIQMDGDLTVTGDITLDDIVADTIQVGGGYALGSGSTFDTDGNGQFSGDLDVGGSLDVGGVTRITATTPSLRFIESDAAADNGIYDFAAGSNKLLGRMLNDAESSADSWLSITRSANTATLIELIGTTVDVSNDLDVGGDFTQQHTGTSTLTSYSTDGTSIVDIHSTSTNTSRLQFRNTGAGQFQINSYAGTLSFWCDVTNITSAIITETTGDWDFNYDVNIDGALDVGGVFTLNGATGDILLPSTGTNLDFNYAGWNYIRATNALGQLDFQTGGGQTLHLDQNNDAEFYGDLDVGGDFTQRHTGLSTMVVESTDGNTNFGLRSVAGGEARFYFLGTNDAFQIRWNDTTKLLEFFCDESLNQVSASISETTGDWNFGYDVDIDGDLYVTNGFSTLAKTSALQALQVNSGSTVGAPTVVGSEVAVFRRNPTEGDDASIAIVGGNAGLSGVFLGDRNNIDVAFVSQNHSTQTLSLGTNAATQLSMTSTAVDVAVDLDVTGDLTVAGGFIDFQGTAPSFRFTETDASVDYKIWDFVAASNQFKGRLWNDALGVAVDWLKITRSGTTPTVIDLTANTVSTSSDLDVSGTLTATGGTVYIGVDESVAADVNLYGNATTSGPRLKLWNSGSEKTTIANYQLHPNNLNFQIGSNLNTNLWSLSYAGNVAMTGTLTGVTTVTTSGNVTVGGDLTIGDNVLEFTTAGNHYYVASNATGTQVFQTGGSNNALILNANQSAQFYSDLDVLGNLDVGGALDVTTTLDVTGVATLGIVGSTAIANTANIGSATMSTTGLASLASLSVTGDVTLSGIHKTAAQAGAAGKPLGGVYTPTITGVVNVSGTPTASDSFFVQLGNTVFVMVHASIVPTASSTLTIARISLPLTTTLGALTDVTGHGFADYSLARVMGDATNNDAQLDFSSQDTSSHDVHVSFSYEI